MKILILISIIIFLFASGCTSEQTNKINLDQLTCIYDNDGQLTCGSSWTAVHKGIEYMIKANEPTKLPEETVIGLSNPANPEDTYFIYTRVGEIELSEETTRRAVGILVAGGKADPPIVETPGDTTINEQLEFLDCGKSLPTEELFDSTSQQDEAMICVGNYLLDNCKKSKVTIPSSNKEQIEFQILGKKDGVCMGNIVYGPNAAINANQSWTCPINLEGIKSRIIDEGKEVTEASGQLGFNAYAFVSISVAIQKSDCTRSD